MKAIVGYNVPKAYSEALWKMRVWAKEADSRNGPVMEAEDVFLRVMCPTERVLFDPIRNANPFFHVMEFIWMMSGSNHVEWLASFNSRMRTYADPDTNEIHGAYGYRWRHHFGGNQITRVAEILHRDPDTRRAVVAMWDPREDQDTDKLDLPCNTHIYFTVKNSALNMTVCNRSNDLIWGMLGANVVHMTLLQEMLAGYLNLGIGEYMVYTKNLHVYKSLPNFESVWRTLPSFDPYKEGRVSPTPLLVADIEEFMDECYDFIEGYHITHPWLRDVATPMRETYLARLDGRSGREELEHVKAEDWKLAALEYIERKELAAQA